MNNLRPPQELIDTILQDGGYGDEDIAIAKGLDVLLSRGRGITLKQWKLLEAIVSDEEMARMGDLYDNDWRDGHPLDYGDR